jgi:hypothetical protein
VSFDGGLLTADDVRRAVKPLRLIFWGGLLCIFDFTFGQTTNGRATVARISLPYPLRRNRVE